MAVAKRRSSGLKIRFPVNDPEPISYNWDRIGVNEAVGRREKHQPRVNRSFKPAKMKKQPRKLSTHERKRTSRLRTGADDKSNA